MPYEIFWRFIEFFNILINFRPLQFRTSHSSTALSTNFSPAYSSYPSLSLLPSDDSSVPRFLSLSPCPILLLSRFLPLPLTIFLVVLSALPISTCLLCLSMHLTTPSLLSLSLLPVSLYRCWVVPTWLWYLALVVPPSPPSPTFPSFNVLFGRIHPSFTRLPSLFLLLTAVPFTFPFAPPSFPPLSLPSPPTPFQMYTVLKIHIV